MNTNMTEFGWFSKYFCILVLCKKVASALERLIASSQLPMLQETRVPMKKNLVTCNFPTFFGLNSSLAAVLSLPIPKTAGLFGWSTRKEKTEGNGQYLKPLGYWGSPQKRTEKKR